MNLINISLRMSLRKDSLSGLHSAQNLLPQQLTAKTGLLEEVGEPHEGGL